MNKTVIAVLVGMLAGGGAIAAYQGLGLGTPYADVVSATPVTVKEPIYGEVIASTPIVQTVSGPRQVCEDQVVEKRRPERFGDKDGMVVGAVVGGLVGSQVGGGNGKKLATVAGAVGGAYAGREIDRRHEGGQKYTEVEKVCRTVTETRDEVVGYDVQYRSEGLVASQRMDKKPGEQILLGERDKVIAWDVDWRYGDQTGSIRMAEEPGDKLEMKDGAIVVAAEAAPPQG